MLRGYGLDQRRCRIILRLAGVLATYEKKKSKGMFDIGGSTGVNSIYLGVSEGVSPS